MEFEDKNGGKVGQFKGNRYGMGMRMGMRWCMTLGYRMWVLMGATSDASFGLPGGGQWWGRGW